jgi:hypothetical protein
MDLGRLFVLPRRRSRQCGSLKSHLPVSARRHSLGNVLQVLLGLLGSLLLIVAQMLIFAIIGWLFTRDKRGFAVGAVVGLILFWCGVSVRWLFRFVPVP